MNCRKESIKIKNNDSVAPERFALAQVWEKDFWTKVWKDDLSRQAKSRLYWKYYIEILKNHTELRPNHNVLDIGCGPFGIISYLDQGQRFGLDPLMDFYSANFKMSEGVSWEKGCAEALPFENKFFDVVITTNTIDHTQSPKTVLGEINRVLKDDGFLFLTIHGYSRRVRAVKVFLERIGWGDPPHPYSFNVKEVKELINESGFSLIGTRRGIGNLDFWVGGDKVANAKTLFSRTKDYISRAAAIGKTKGTKVLLKTLGRFMLLFLLLDTQRSADTIFLARKQRASA